MALELKFKYEITADRSTLIITDQTGEYSASNVGGWGAPNTDRSSVGLYMLVRYQPYNKPMESLDTIVPIFSYNTSFDNDYESSFEFDYKKDGWYKILMLALTEAEYDAIEDPNDFFNNNDNFDSVYSEDIILVNLIVQKNCMLEKYFECLQCNSCKCDDNKEELLKLNAGIQAVDYRFYSLKQFEAQRMTEKLTKQYKCCKGC